MMDVDYTCTNDFYLCTDCGFNNLTCYSKGMDTPNGIFYCQRFDRAVCKVGICKYYYLKGGAYDRQSV
ncbi:MAG: hypothetical protein IIY21_20790 [Clostridiales bacterium]|nr:hypothetical protein [Clostridiales bacterium]